MTPTVIGIDLGGTNVRAGVLTRDGHLLHVASTPIEAARGPQAGLERINDLIEQVLHATGDFTLQAIGIGSTGPIDRERGAIQNPYTLPTWEDVDIVHPLAGHFGVPVTLDNDANAAALGEYWLGAGQRATRMYLFTVGTGVGTACVLNGEIYRGQQGIHPEAGHMLVDPSGPECYCGGRGCLESLIAGPSIAQWARVWAQDDTLPQDAREIAALARAGHASARTVIDRAAGYLALGLVNVMMMLVPDVVVFAGGVMQNYDLFAPILQEALQRHYVLVPGVTVRLVPATLGDNAGVIGAGYAAWTHLTHP